MDGFYRILFIYLCLCVGVVWCDRFFCSGGDVKSLVIDIRHDKERGAAAGAVPAFLDLLPHYLSLSIM